LNGISIKKLKVKRSYSSISKSTSTSNSNIYPPNHILNSENQKRKERKELFNTFDFWEKYSHKIYQALPILLDKTYKMPPYKILIDIFTKPEDPKKTI
jgi:hypothetical protein